MALNRINPETLDKLAERTTQGGVVAQALRDAAHTIRALSARLEGLGRNALGPVVRVTLAVTQEGCVRRVYCDRHATHVTISEGAWMCEAPWAETALDAGLIPTKMAEAVAAAHELECPSRPAPPKQVVARVTVPESVAEALCAECAVEGKHPGRTIENIVWRWIRGQREQRERRPKVRKGVKSR